MSSAHFLLRKVIFAITGPDLFHYPTGFRTPYSDRVLCILTLNSDALTMYGFRYPWPSQFDVRDLEPSLRFERKSIPPRCKESTLLSPILWFLANSIGIRMVYPGCLDIFNSISMEPRMKSLEVMRNRCNIKRVGLVTREGLFVESFYADRRRDDTEKGNTLVICCEGNAGFSEIGIVSVPLNEGYSVLAWNHPGFGSSMVRVFFIPVSIIVIPMSLARLEQTFIELVYNLFITLGCDWLETDRYLISCSTWHNMTDQTTDRSLNDDRSCYSLADIVMTWKWHVDDVASILRFRLTAKRCFIFLSETHRRSSPILNLFAWKEAVEIVQMRDEGCRGEKRKAGICHKYHVMLNGVDQKIRRIAGMPFPEQEKNAIEAVVLFALHHLHFEPEDIRLFGWSIGGFTATWAAMHLPRVGGLVERPLMRICLYILDATFDTLDELSRRAVPIFGEKIPVSMVQRYFDLNNAEMITRRVSAAYANINCCLLFTQYPGPIRIIRRSNDEVISTDRNILMPKVGLVENQLDSSK
ncbi:hypothetical protein ACTXT7_003812 [Hymenolepis weldensis]